MPGRLKTPSVWIALMGVIMVGGIGMFLADHTSPTSLDDQVTAWVWTNAPTWMLTLSRGADLVFSTLGSMILTVTLMVAMAQWRGWRAGVATLVFVISPIAVTFAMKLGANRPRPSTFASHHAILTPSDPSFPSGHTAAAAAIAGVMAVAWWVDRRWAAIAVLIVAPLVALSRMVVGVHFPTDVLAGLLVVAAVDLVVLRTLPWAVKALRGQGIHAGEGAPIQ